MDFGNILNVGHLISTANATGYYTNMYFGHTISYGIPCAFLWMATIYKAYYRKEQEEQMHALIKTVHLALSIMLFCFALIERSCLVATFITGSSLYELTLPFLHYKPLTFILATLLIWFSKTTTFKILRTFWLLVSVETLILYGAKISTLQTAESWKAIPTADLAAISCIPLTIAHIILSLCANVRRTHPKTKSKCPERSASIWSKLTLSWFTPMARLGMKRPLKQDDLWELDETDQADHTLREFLKHWEKSDNQSLTSKPEKSGIGIFKALLVAFWWPLSIAALIRLAESFVTFLNPVTLDSVLSFMSSDEPAWKGCLYALIMFTSSSMISILDSQYYLKIRTVTMHMHSCLMSLIYRKSLRVCSGSVGEFSTADVVNLTSLDASKVVDCFKLINRAWSTPLQICISLYLLWNQLGVAAFFGFAVLLMLSPVNVIISRYTKGYRKSLMREKDKRIKLMNELLTAIKVLKLFAWETVFAGKISDVRRKEMKTLKSWSYVSAGTSFVYACTPIFVSLASFAAYVLINDKNVLDAKKVFVSLSLFNILKGRIGFLPRFLGAFSAATVSFDRINRYLRAAELHSMDDGSSKEEGRSICFTNASFSWDKNSEAILENINLNFESSKLVAVVGNVGSGKSALLSAILGEMNKKSGTVQVYGSVAYVPQQAWIQNQTIRQNILFTKPMDEERYRRVLELCALEPDLEILRGGDLCEIGEKGINLSGGQKQRVSLARAVYFDADIYLLDDPLSAVDAHVSRKLFDEVIGPKGILSSKTRVLVTHRLTVLPQVDEIVVLKNGKISERGSYAELVEKNGEFAEILLEHLEHDESEEQGKEDDRKATRQLSQPAILKELNALEDNSRDERTNGRVNTGKDDEEGRLVQEERVEAYGVKWAVYKECVATMGLTAILLTLICSLLSPILNASTKLWLTAWTNDGVGSKDASSTYNRNSRLLIYALLGIGEGLFVLISTITLNQVCMKGAEVLHNSMLNRIIRAPMSFFEMTPVGRMLNRFSQDIDTADAVMRDNIRTFITTFLRAVISLSLVCYESPLVTTTLIPLAFFYYTIQRYDVATSRQLQRLKSVARSPLYTHVTESVTGANSIRAFNVCSTFEQEFHKRIDNYNRTSYASSTAGHWLYIRLEFLGDCVVFFAALFAVLYRESVTPAIAGLTITYAMTISSTLGILVSASSSLESNVVAVERCLEYCKAPMEEPEVMERKKSRKEWPERGKIRFSNYCSRYRPGLPLVLKYISCEIQPREKVGVVGRTGAGKSTFSMALFRMLEPVEGTIFIDDIDITTISLEDLRSRLTIIPQDPVLFTGPLRRNLDPTELHCEEDLWRALRMVHLDEHVTSLDSGLSHEVVEGGENFSVGQRQLLCLARAILRSSKILVLDEATAAVDYETDSQIQRTIREEFKDCTVITIAHRLNTVMDYDRILVLNEGEALEFDSPKKLLSNSNSTFYAMAKDAGIV